MKKILISACLAGDRVRYDGKRVPLTNPALKQWQKNGVLVNVCPEVSGGLAIPRFEAQIVNGNGQDVLNGKAKVMDINGNEVTVFFIKGAEHALRVAKAHQIELAILKEKSPSCGVHCIYNGSFNSTVMAGFGVTAAILKQNGIKVFSETELDQVKCFIDRCYLSGLNQMSY